MKYTIDIEDLIQTSTEENFQTNLRKAVEEEISKKERLAYYNEIANSLYSDGDRVYAIYAWGLGEEYLDDKEVNIVEKADLLKSYGLAWMELNHFDIAVEYLHEAEVVLGSLDDSILIDIYFGLSIVYKYLTNIEKAIEYNDKATTVAKRLNNYFEVSRAYLNSGNLFLKTNQYEKAEESYLDALKYANMDEVKSNIFMSLGLLYKNRYEYEKAKEMFVKAEELFTQLGFVNETFELYINYGTLYPKLGMFGKAKDYLEKSLKYFETIDDSYNSVICYLNLGRVEQDRANFSKALSYFTKAIELSESNSNLISIVSLLFYSRGSLYHSWRKYNKAYGDYNKALEYAQNQHDRAMIASVKNGLAGIYADRGEIEKAEKVYQEIVKIFEEDNNIEEVVATYTNIALLYEARGMYELAQIAHEKALEFSELIDIPQLKISVLINLAELFGSLVKINKAIELYNRALSLLEYYDNDDLLSKCYLNLANIYESTNQFETALKYAKEALILKEELKQDKSLYIVYDALGRIYDGLKNIEEAEVHYNKALKSAKQQNIAHYYGMLVNYGLFLFKFKNNIKEAFACYDKAKEYFLKENPTDETLIAIYSNYAMIYKSIKENQKAIEYYQRALEYANKFISFMENEDIMMKYRINFEHIYENLIELYLEQKEYSKAFYYLEGTKSRTFSKILSSKMYNSTLIPKELIEREKELKDNLKELLTSGKNITVLNNEVLKIHKLLKSLYSEMESFDERYVWMKENRNTGVVDIRWRM